MALTPGTRLGPYEILSAIGAGGMGEVYKARDTRLDRTVALKILPETLAADPQFRERFDREARAISQLTHPHICTLYDVGEQQGTAFLIMEYLEGETLADRLKKGALPLDDAFKVATQIADALSTAHRHGIVHRDLKPGNVMLTRSGVKLLDFGLAKLAPAAPFGIAGTTAAATQSAPLTGQGILLGTLQYMAPEQLEGKPADARTDIFAFGAVVYEMVTGKKAFEGKSQASLISAIMSADPPPIARLQPLVPPGLDRVVNKCLAKDAEARWHSAHDLHDELVWVAGDAASAVPVAPAPRSSVRWRVATYTVAMLAASLVVGTAIWFARPVVPPLRVSRFLITLPSAAALTINGADRDLAITPDGTRVVYVGANGSALFVRALDQFDATRLTDLGAPRGPFISPDGQWIGFADGTTVLKKVALGGGPAVMLTRLDGTGPRGATWGRDDIIVFATTSVATGLQQIPAAGGKPTVLTRPNRADGEADHLWPEFLPDGQAVLFTITPATGGVDAASVAVLDLQTGAQTILIRGGSDAHYVRSGHLVYAAAGTLRAVPFDLANRVIVGPPVPVVSEVVSTPQGLVDAVVADDGTLVYVPGRVVAGAERTLVWVDRQGREEPVKAPPRGYIYPRLAPDATRLALAIFDQETDVWLWDQARAALTRVTFDPGLDAYPVWTPDSRRLLFSSERVEARNLFAQEADGTGAIERLTGGLNNQNATAVSPDGRLLVFTEVAPGTGEDVMMLLLSGPHQAEPPSQSSGEPGQSSTSAPRQAQGVVSPSNHEVRPLIQTPFAERNGEISPDGRWLAYEANDSGQFEIYVRPFPEVTSGRWQVSTGGGTRPLWARSGRELFYMAPTAALMRVDVERGPAWVATAPVQLFEGRYLGGSAGFLGRTYDVSPDGRRFLMIKPGGTDSMAGPTSLVVVQNWVEELKRLVPTK